MYYNNHILDETSNSEIAHNQRPSQDSRKLGTGNFGKGLYSQENQEDEKSQNDR